MKAEISPGCSDHEIMEFGILNRGNKAVSGIATLELRRANSNFLKDLPGSIPWVRALKGKGDQASSLTFKNCFFQANYRCIHMSKK